MAQSSNRPKLLFGPLDITSKRMASREILLPFEEALSLGGPVAPESRSVFREKTNKALQLSRSVASANPHLWACDPDFNHHCLSGIQSHKNDATYRFPHRPVLSNFSPHGDYSTKTVRVCHEHGEMEGRDGSEKKWPRKPARLPQKEATGDWYITLKTL